MTPTCTCFCHPHTQWGPDSDREAQVLGHPDCECVCCRMANTLPDVPQTFTQEAPWPFELIELIGQARAFENWKFRWSNGPRGQGSSGLTLEIWVVGPDSYRPEHERTVIHSFVVPAASYGRKSWARWLHGRCEDVLRHELGEHLRFVTAEGETRPWAPLHGPGEDPYFPYEMTTWRQVRTSNTGRVKPDPEDDDADRQ